MIGSLQGHQEHKPVFQGQLVGMGHSLPDLDIKSSSTMQFSTPGGFHTSQPRGSSRNIFLTCTERIPLGENDGNRQATMKAFSGMTKPTFKIFEPGRKLHVSPIPQGTAQDTQVNTQSLEAEQEEEEQELELPSMEPLQQEDSDVASPPARAQQGAAELTTTTTADLPYHDRTKGARESNDLLDIAQKRKSEHTTESNKKRARNEEGEPERRPEYSEFKQLYRQYAQEFIAKGLKNAGKPKAEQAHIWSFIRHIGDESIREWVFSCLLKNSHGLVVPNTRKDANFPISFRASFTWRKFQQCCPGQDEVPYDLKYVVKD